MSTVNITLAKALGYLVLYFIQLYLLVLYALCVAHCDPLWSKSFKTALVEYVESGLDVVDLWKTTTITFCLFTKADNGC